MSAGNHALDAGGREGREVYVVGAVVIMLLINGRFVNAGGWRLCFMRLRYWRVSSVFLEVLEMMFCMLGVCGEGVDCNENCHNGNFQNSKLACPSQ